ncbi:MAG: SagB/ThcOx family dehydrogenase [Bryobacterales bacterium]|nr:SagB/ThcOx family dehydrogenase [Bryobacteraceae bacterium]MDW8130750.1 SagB/ThcOx family dehydrogenase [Bryobacterales bacterium]
MNRRTWMKSLPAMAMLAGQRTKAAPEPLVLPAPQTEGGRPLMQALRDRKTTREIAPDPLPAQVLSNLLWAGFGVNRREGPMGRPGRTAPSAMNLQEIEIYVALPQGVFRYEAVPHRLVPVLPEDIRPKVGRRPAAAQAPVSLIYVTDWSKFAKVQQPDLRNSFTSADVGFIAQNVYLYCASEGLASWFHTPDREALSKLLGLGEQQQALYVHSVGYPAKK